MRVLVYNSASEQVIVDYNKDSVSINLKQIIDKIPPNNSKLSYLVGDYLVNYESIEGIIYLVIINKDEDRHKAFALIGKLQRVDDLTEPTVAGLVDTPTHQLQNNLNHVKQVMIDNVDQIIARGDRIDNLVDRTNDMSSQAFAFRKRSTTLRRQMWYKNKRIQVLTAFVGVVSDCVLSVLSAFPTHSCLDYGIPLHFLFLRLVLVAVLMLLLLLSLPLPCTICMTYPLPHSSIIASLRSAAKALLTSTTATMNGITCGHTVQYSAIPRLHSLLSQHWLYRLYHRFLLYQTLAILTIAHQAQPTKAPRLPPLPLSHRTGKETGCLCGSRRQRELGFEGELSVLIAYTPSSHSHRSSESAPAVLSVSALVSDVFSSHRSSLRDREDSAAG